MSSPDGGAQTGGAQTNGLRGVDARLALPALVGWLTALVLVGTPGAAVPVAAVALVTLALVGAALPKAASWGVSMRACQSRVDRGDASRGAQGHTAVGRAGAILAASIPSLIAVAVLAVAVALAAPARTPPALAPALQGGGTVLVVLELEESVVPPTARDAGPGGWGGISADALIVEVVTDADDEAGAGRMPVRVPVRVLGLTVDERLSLGTRLEGRVRLIALEAGDDRVALVRPVTLLEPVAAASALLGGADGLRAGFLDLMQPFSGDGAALLPGLAIGDTTAVSDDLDAAMKGSALSHLTAVSGANCAIVVGLVLGLGALARWPRAVRVGAALLALGGFVVLVTPEPSVVRAAVMAAVVLLALSSGRPARGLPVLGLAVLGIVVVDPWIAREYGFALSVLATAALLVLAGPLTAVLARALPAPLALGIAVPLAAQLACQPVLILLAPEVPLTGVVANVLAAPAAPVATIVGMVACLLAAVIPPLATIVAGLAWLPAAWIAGVARVCSGLPGALMPWPEGALGAVLLAGLTAAALVATGVPAVLGTARLRRWFALATVSALVVVVGATAGTAALRSLGRPGDWVIAQCDIGQGDAVLVRSGGAVALIDTGAEPELLEACLQSLGIGRLDLLVLTHFDLDHAGGAPALVGQVDRVLVGPTDGPQDERLVESLAAGGAVVDTVAEGRHGVLGDHVWRVLWPPAHRGVEPGNDASLVLEWRGAPGCAHCPSLLALGDLGADAQRMLASTHDLAPIDVIKVSHHGSADQYEALYTALAAPVALIGVGADNGYGHPAPGILAALDAAGSTVVRSDQHGMALLAWSAPVSSGGGAGGGAGLRLWLERVGAAD